MSEILLLKSGTTLSADEQKFIAWVSLMFSERLSKKVEALLTKKEPCHLSASMTEEHRIKLEARNRKITLPLQSGPIFAPPPLQ